MSERHKLPEGPSGPGEVPVEHDEMMASRAAAPEDSEKLYSPEPEDTEGKCARATKAAMSAVADNCGLDVQPVELPNGVIVNVPTEAMGDLERMSPDEPSDRKVMEMLDDMDAVEEMAEAHCEMSGLREDTDKYDTCEVLFVRELIRSV